MRISRRTRGASVKNNAKYVTRYAIAGVILCLLVPFGHAADAEDVFWASVGKGNREEYELYLEQYPNGRHAQEARQAIESIRAKARADQEAKRKKQAQAEAAKKDEEAAERRRAEQEARKLAEDIRIEQARLEEIKARRIAEEKALAQAREQAEAQRRAGQVEPRRSWYAEQSRAAEKAQPSDQGRFEAPNPARKAEAKQEKKAPPYDRGKTEAPNSGRNLPWYKR